MPNCSILALISAIWAVLARRTCRLAGRSSVILRPSIVSAGARSLRWVGSPEPARDIAFKTERRACNFVVTAPTIPSGFWNGFIEIYLLMIHLTGFVRMPAVKVMCFGSGAQRSAPPIHEYWLHPLFTNVYMFPKPPLYWLGNGYWVKRELVLRKRETSTCVNIYQQASEVFSQTYQPAIIGLTWAVCGYGSQRG